MTKSTKAEANYRGHPNGDKQCSRCSMWEGANRCSAVAGEISERGWCSYWREAKDVTKRAKGGPVFSPTDLIYHDSHGNPDNEKHLRMPYHTTVFPDGTVRYRDPGNPYGAPAPHAYAMNPRSLGLAYSGPSGGMPTPEGMRALQQEYEKIQARFPGIVGRGHGEAFAAYKANPFALPRPSKEGRPIEEASWRNRVTDLSRVPEAGMPALSLLPRSGEAPPETSSAPAPEPPRREIPAPMAL